MLLHNKKFKCAIYAYIIVKCKYHIVFIQDKKRENRHFFWKSVSFVGCMAKGKVDSVSMRVFNMVWCHWKEAKREKIEFFFLGNL